MSLSLPPYCLRSDLPKEKHSSVDAALKDLKACTRRLLTVAQSQRVELQILDQLHYKGNNQHRSALFWNRIEEARRFGKRVEGLEVYDTVESLRVSFWGPQTSLTQKSLKGAWTHVPDTRAVEFALARLKACKLILDKMHQCLTKTYNHLNLNMQTAAFLQLILTLTGIISRLDVLLEDFRTAVNAAWDSMSMVLTILRPEPAASKQIDDAPGPSQASQVHAPSFHALEASPADLEDQPAGQAYTALVSADIPGATLGPAQQRDEGVGDAVVRETGRAVISFKSVNEVSARSGRRQVVDNRMEVSESQLRPTLTRKSSEAPRGVKRKIKRDEIDDIFGL